MKDIPHIADNAESGLRTLCLPLSEEAINTATRLLSGGLPVAIPTETVYGLAANALDGQAVRRIYEAKGRPHNNPLIVHVGRSCGSAAALEATGLTRPLQEGSPQRLVIERLIRAFWPGPLTIVLPRGPAIPDEVAASLPTVAVRMPDHPSLLALLERLPFPLAAPSANRSNRVSPTTAEHVMDELAGRIPLVLDGGACNVGLESTIVAVDDAGKLTLLRPGGLPKESIEAELGAPVLLRSVEGSNPVAPGMQRIHYAPRTPLALAPSTDAAVIQALLAKAAGKQKVGLLLFSGKAMCPPAWMPQLRQKDVVIRSLEDCGDGRLASRSLFFTLRELDQLGLDLILVEEPPTFNDGLWPALRDRLARAAAASTSIL